MITVYHNPRCRKSREGLQMVKNSGKEYMVREYLKDPLSEGEIKSILKKLNFTPIQLIRQNEIIWKENYKDRDLDDGELINILAANPVLLERPVVENENDAVIGRPPSQIEKII